ncbi:phage holin, lambda family [Azoarcus sp. L1K30]|uniref:phage holin, lambda family n=1 Tax=Azoarcus sp. L1K30 TaxID=2820277 RepID=UPI001B82EA8E|nr:phage holin, lambda family [Azoarcus sp. L1K30]MBR0568354.1 phage holin, lambda family [Azoarcus sp. L1K30]
MPEKDIGLLTAIWNSFWEALPEPMKAAIFGTLIAWLRILYDDREPRGMRRFLEGLFCGAIALAISSGAEAIGLPSGLGTFVGAVIGLFGADKVRDLGYSIAQRKADRL